MSHERHRRPTLGKRRNKGKWDITRGTIRSLFGGTRCFYFSLVARIGIAIVGFVIDRGIGEEQAWHDVFVCLFIWLYLESYLCCSLKKRSLQPLLLLCHFLHQCGFERKVTNATTWLFWVWHWCEAWPNLCYCTKLFFQDILFMWLHTTHWDACHISPSCSRISTGICSV